MGAGQWLGWTMSMLVIASPIVFASIASARSGPEIYRAACANCHGADGRGAPASLTAIDIPLPDFTDCRFASREPLAEWIAVVHRGGPVRAFAAMMPSFGDALTDDEIARVLAHVKTLCTDRAWPQGELNLPRAFFTEKAYPEDEAVMTTTVETHAPRGVSNQFVYERRIGARDQIEIAVPVDARAGAANTSWSGGIGDVAIALKHVLFHSTASGRILSAGAEVSLPTGDRDTGFGTGTTIVEPFVAFGQMLPSDAFLHVHGGIELPADTGRAGRELFWRAAIGKTFSQRRFDRAWSPMTEILGARELADDQPVQWDVVPQMQVTLSRRQHVMASAGVRIPLTQRDERHAQVLGYVLWDWFDGGLFDGW
jgi:Cytochrome C oxidase, cbb3-type, subunit III